jgi:hypothetical protein
MKKLFLVLIVLTTACSQAVPSTPSLDSIQTSIVNTLTALPAESTQTSTPLPTNTPTETKTPAPTRTPRPTNTPRPSPTFTPPPKPIVLTGKGDQVVDVKKWDGPALASVKYTGGGNFVIYNYDPDGNKISLLINTIGNYTGVRPLDFLNGEETVRFQVESNGNWEITILPLEEIEMLRVPGSYDGNGDNVLALPGSKPDLLKVDATKAKGNFVIWGYADTRNLLVNEIAPYDGTTILQSGTLALVIEAEGPWHIEITAK